jgi:CheY-like chemotaxis protein
MPYKRRSPFSYTFSILQFLAVLKKMDFFNNHAWLRQQRITRKSPKMGITISRTGQFGTVQKMTPRHTRSSSGRWCYMTQTKTSASHRVLLVDDDEAVRAMMSATLERKGFEAIPACDVTEALKLITTESFDVLITDLHMPNPSDGFAVVTAMRHVQPDALTLLVSGYPDVKSASGRYSSTSGRYHRETIRGRETGRNGPREAAHS